jgi:membrane peptidoglycan carboxypeptidase
VNAQNARTTKRPAPKGKRRFLTRKRILLTLLGLFLAGVATVAVAWVAIGIPTPNQLAEAQASIVYYSDGKTEMDRITQVDGNRESVPLSKVPVHVQHALLAAEDRSFYQNKGVSPTGIGRALVAAVKGGPTQGGSTITQQYVKNYFLTQDQTLTRKGKELIISLKIDQQKSKSEILADYLNTIYYGRGAYGIQTASKAYFDKDVSQLTVSEGALLASVIRGPGFYDPSLGAQQKKNAQARVNYVLDGMQAEGWLTPAQRAKATFPTVISPKAKKTKGGSIGYITADVQQELRTKLRLTDAELDRGGLRITTTINKQAQDAAVKAVQDNMPTGPGTSTLHAGLAAVEPGNGAVVAMYGGKDYTKVQLNSATGATMQAGSTFKPFGLIAALEQGISTHTTFPGYSPQTFPEFGTGKDGVIHNFADEQFGSIDLQTATAHSVNTVFARLNIEVGADKTRAAAIAAGVPAGTPGLEDNLSNIFGTANPHVIDMANAYATIAAKGMRATPYLVKKVTSADGTVNYKAQKQTKVAFDQDVAIDATEAMTHVVTEGTGQGALALGRPAAGKTGTTTENKAVWFDGFTPQLAAAVGIYNDVNGKPEPMQNIAGFGELTGGTFPVKIWTAFMSGALEGTKTVDFPSRTGVGDNQVPTTTTAPSTTSESSTSSSSTTSSSSSSSTTTSTSPTSSSSTTTSSSPTSTGPTSSTESPSSTSKPKPKPSKSGQAPGATGVSSGLPSGPAKRVRAEPTPTGTAN